MAIRKGIYHLIYLACLLPTWGWGTNLQPWVGNFLEFEWRNFLVYQTYSDVAKSSRLIRYSSNDLFLTTSLSNSIAEFSLEIEVSAARTHRQKWDIDDFRISGRYMWLDDILGDPISLTTGVSLIQSFQSSLHDISSFHHGRSEAELFISLGQEMSQEATWKSRWWIVGGVGVAERGSSWLRANLDYEYRVRDKNEWRLFAHTLWGLGHKQLSIHHFHGYGSIQHQSIDLGLRYTRLIDFFGSFSVEYSNRVYARNFPAHAHRFLLTLLYTFGL